MPSLYSGLFLDSLLIAWKNSQYIAYPDGRGRIFQPRKLIQAFDILAYYWDKFESQRIKNA
jgi:hypothetical protein